MLFTAKHLVAVLVLGNIVATGHRTIKHQEHFSQNLVNVCLQCEKRRKVLIINPQIVKKMNKDISNTTNLKCYYHDQLIVTMPQNDESPSNVKAQGIFAAICSWFNGFIVSYFGDIGVSKHCVDCRKQIVAMNRNVRIRSDYMQYIYENVLFIYSNTKKCVNPNFRRRTKIIIHKATQSSKTKTTTATNAQWFSSLAGTSMTSPSIQHSVLNETTMETLHKNTSEKRTCSIPYGLDVLLSYHSTTRKAKGRLKSVKTPGYYSYRYRRCSSLCRLFIRHLKLKSLNTECKTCKLGSTFKGRNDAKRPNILHPIEKKPTQNLLPILDTGKSTLISQSIFRLKCQRIRYSTTVAPMSLSVTKRNVRQNLPTSFFSLINTVKSTLVSLKIFRLTCKRNIPLSNATLVSSNKTTPVAWQIGSKTPLTKRRYFDRFENEKGSLIILPVIDSVCKLEASRNLRNRTIDDLKKTEDKSKPESKPRLLDYRKDEQLSFSVATFVFLPKCPMPKYLENDMEVKDFKILSEQGTDTSEKQSTESNTLPDSMKIGTEKIAKEMSELTSVLENEAGINVNEKTVSMKVYESTKLSSRYKHDSPRRSEIGFAKQQAMLQMKSGVMLNGVELIERSIGKHVTTDTKRETYYNGKIEPVKTSGEQDVSYTRTVLIKPSVLINVQDLPKIKNVSENLLAEMHTKNEGKIHPKTLLTVIRDQRTENTKLIHSFFKEEKIVSPTIKASLTAKEIIASERSPERPKSHLEEPLQMHRRDTEYLKGVKYSTKTIVTPSPSGTKAKISKKTADLLESSIDTNGVLLESSEQLTPGINTGAGIKFDAGLPIEHKIGKKIEENFGSVVGIEADKEVVEMEKFKDGRVSAKIETSQEVLDENEDEGINKKSDEDVYNIDHKIEKSLHLGGSKEIFLKGTGESTTYIKETLQIEHDKTYFSLNELETTSHTLESQKTEFLKEGFSISVFPMKINISSYRDLPLDDSEEATELEREQLGSFAVSTYLKHQTEESQTKESRVKEGSKIRSTNEYFLRLEPTKSMASNAKNVIAPTSMTEAPRVKQMISTASKNLLSTMKLEKIGKRFVHKNEASFLKLKNDRQEVKPSLVLKNNITKTDTFSSRTGFYENDHLESISAVPASVRRSDEPPNHIPKKTTVFHTEKTTTRTKNKEIEKREDGESNDEAIGDRLHNLLFADFKSALGKPDEQGQVHEVSPEFVVLLTLAILVCYKLIRTSFWRSLPLSPLLRNNDEDYQDPRDTDDVKPKVNSELLQREDFLENNSTSQSGKLPKLETVIWIADIFSQADGDIGYEIRRNWHG